MALGPIARGLPRSITPHVDGRPYPSEHLIYVNDQEERLLRAMTDGHSNKTPWGPQSFVDPSGSWGGDMSGTQNASNWNGSGSQPNSYSGYSGGYGNYGSYGAATGGGIGSDSGSRFGSGSGGGSDSASSRSNNGQNFSFTPNHQSASENSAVGNMPAAWRDTSYTGGGNYWHPLDGANYGRSQPMPSSNGTGFGTSRYVTADSVPAIPGNGGGATYTPESHRIANTMIAPSANVDALVSTMTSTPAAAPAPMVSLPAGFDPTKPAPQADDALPDTSKATSTDGSASQPKDSFDASYTDPNMMAWSNADVGSVYGGNPANVGVSDYIRQQAIARGIDPNVALRVAESEGGLKNPFRHGEGPAPSSQDPRFGSLENSYGPFQMYISGHGDGLGDKALAMGIDPQKDWQGGVNYALDNAQQNGWGAWYGAAHAGVGNWDGIDRNAPRVAPTPGGGGGIGFPSYNNYAFMSGGPDTSNTMVADNGFQISPAADNMPAPASYPGAAMNGGLGMVGFGSSSMMGGQIALANQNPDSLGVYATSVPDYGNAPVTQVAANDVPEIGTPQSGGLYGASDPTTNGGLSPGQTVNVPAQLATDIKSPTVRRIAMAMATPKSDPQTLATMAYLNNGISSIGNGRGGLGPIAAGNSSTNPNLSATQKNVLQAELKYASPERKQEILDILAGKQPYGMNFGSVYQAV